MVKARVSKSSKAKVQNPYRDGSSYATCFAVLADMALDKPATRKDLIQKAANLTGKDEKLLRYDMAVVLSPRKDGESHRSAKKASDVYWVERMAEPSMVRLHLR